MQQLSPTEFQPVIERVNAALREAAEAVAARDLIIADRDATLTQRNERIKTLELQIEKLLGRTPAQGPEPRTSSPSAGPIRCQANTVYDGNGSTIDAAGLGTVFSISGVKNVTVRNWRVINASGMAIDIWQSTNVIVENITIENVNGAVISEPTFGVQCRQSQDVLIRGIKAGVVASYLVFLEDVQDVAVEQCVLSKGARYENGLRAMGSLTRVKFINNTISASLNPAKWTSLRVQGYGDDIEIRGGKYMGQSALGPMGEDDGGQKETDPVRRKAKLARRLTNVRSIDVVYEGGLGLMAGLEAQILGGHVIGHAGPEYKNSAGKVLRQNAGAYPIWKLTWSYPEKEHLRAGDPVRPAPVGHFRGVTFASANDVRTLTYGNSNGSMKVIECKLNAKPI